jgi:hypothetical protein
MLEGGPILTAAILGILAHGSVDGCPPIALLSGDSGLVEAVRVELASRGIVETPVPHCDAIGIRLVSRRGEVHIEVERGDGDGIRRTAVDARSAATIIESWVREDVMAPLLDHRLPPDEREPLIPHEPPGARARARAPAPPPQEELGPRPFAFGVGAVVGLADDGSTWSGVDVHGCLQLWRLCLGARFQWSIDLEVAGDALRLDGGRSVLDFAVTADVPFVFGPFEIAPGIGSGVSIIRTDRDVRPDVEVRDEKSGLRLRGALGLSWRFADHFSARLDVAVDWAPAARTEIYENVTEDGPEDFALPGEPDVVVWLRGGFEAGGI